MINLHILLFKGHLLLQSLRDNIINQSQKANPNWYLVRDLIGQYLFTLQEFYSNSNWVEMFGSRVCLELGIFGYCYDIEDHLSRQCIFLLICILLHLFIKNILQICETNRVIVGISGNRLPFKVPTEMQVFQSCTCIGGVQ